MARLPELAQRFGIGQLRRPSAALIIVLMTGAACAIPWISRTYTRADAAAAPATSASASVVSAGAGRAESGGRAESSGRAESGGRITAAGRAAPSPAEAPRDETIESDRASFRAAPTPSPTSAPESVSRPNPTTATAAGYGCDAALAYLAANAAPGFQFQCPGYAYGHQAMTCVNHAPQCPGRKLIAINVPCAAAYMNEASNSWVLTSQRSGSIDPYGYCH